MGVKITVTSVKNAWFSIQIIICYSNGIKVKRVVGSVIPASVNKQVLYVAFQICVEQDC